MPNTLEEAIKYLETGVTDGYEPPFRYRKLIFGLLQEQQQVLLAAESCFQLPNFLKNTHICSFMLLCFFFIPECSLRLYGSSLTKFALKSSDVNIDIKFPPKVSN